MSAFIGNVKGPHNESPQDAAEVWCSSSRVELTLNSAEDATAVFRTLDPIAARNLAALLIRAAEEAERMAARRTED